MNNFLIKKEEDFIAKIKNFFRRFICYNKKTGTLKEETFTKNFAIKNENIISNIRVEPNQDKVFKEMQLEKEREMLLSKINDNPRMLESLSYERLKQIDEYCDICINKYKDKIKRIQNVN